MSPNGQPEVGGLLLVELARLDHSPVVRREIASLLPRLPTTGRQDILEMLLRNAEDTDDPNLPYLYWYALESMADINASRSLTIAASAKLPQLLPWMARKIGIGSSAPII